MNVASAASAPAAFGFSVICWSARARSSGAEARTRRSSSTTTHGALSTWTFTCTTGPLAMPPMGAPPAVTRSIGPFVSTTSRSDLHAVHQVGRARCGPRIERTVVGDAHVGARVARLLSDDAVRVGVCGRGDGVARAEEREEVAEDLRRARRRCGRSTPRARRTAGRIRGRSPPRSRDRSRAGRSSRSSPERGWLIWMTNSPWPPCARSSSKTSRGVRSRTTGAPPRGSDASTGSGHALAWPQGWRLASDVSSSPGIDTSDALEVQRRARSARDRPRRCARSRRRPRPPRRRSTRRGRASRRARRRRASCAGGSRTPGSRVVSTTLRGDRRSSTVWPGASVTSDLRERVLRAPRGGDAIRAPRERHVDDAVRRGGLVARGPGGVRRAEVGRGRAVGAVEGHLARHRPAGGVDAEDARARGARDGEIHVRLAVRASPRRARAPGPRDRPRPRTRASYCPGGKSALERARGPRRVDRERLRRGAPRDCPRPGAPARRRARPPARRVTAGPASASPLDRDETDVDAARPAARRSVSARSRGSRSRGARPRRGRAA